MPLHSQHKFLFLILSMSLLSACNSLFFQPEKKHYIEPAQIHLQAKNIYFKTSDGLTLHGWFLPAKKQAQASILFLHGNAQNISTHIASVYWLPAAGFNVFLFDYRGYGYSEGKPSIEGLLIDFRAALDTLRNIRGVNPEKIFIFGQSLGAAISLQGLARYKSRKKIKGLIVEGAFTGYRDLSREVLNSFWLTWPFQWPLSYTITDCCRPIDAIKNISPVPVLIVHSKDDQIIPVHHALELYAAARAPKQLWLYNRYAHIQIFKDKKNRTRLIKYLRAELSKKHEPPPRHKLTGIKL